MTVAYFIGSLNRGGTETLVLDTFRRRDVTSVKYILIYRNDGDLTEAYRATGVPMFRIKPTGFKLGYIRNLRRLLKREGVDVLHTQTVWNGLLGVFCTSLTRVKLVSSFHGFLSTVLNKIVAHFVLWCSDASVFVSDYERKWYEKSLLFVPKKRCHVVYNGIDFSKFDQKYPTPDFLNDNVSSPRGMMRMVMVGNFVRGRSQFFLCRVMKALRESGEGGFLCYFIGKRSSTEPERFDDCVRYCRENGLLDTSVFFSGGRSDIPAILQHVDAFVYSSDYDTFGIAVVEAMAAGIPVIVNDWDVMREITDDGLLAALYRTRDVADCLAKIEDLAGHLPERKTVAKEVGRLVRQRYSIENHIRCLFDVYASTLG